MRDAGADFFTAVAARPVVLAHRGMGSGISPEGFRENTLESLLEAVRHGADWVEFDVQASADGDLMLRHDVLLDAEAIRRTSTRSLRRLGLATLEDAHDVLPGHVGFDLDVKVSLYDLPGRGDDVLFQTALAWARSARRVRPVLLSSFCPTLPALAHDVPTAWTTNSSAWYYESVTSALRLGAAVVGVHATDVLDVPAGCPSAESVSAVAREYGLAVLAWDVQPVQVPALIARGVTGLCGDDVDGLVAALMSRQAAA